MWNCYFESVQLYITACVQKISLYLQRAHVLSRARYLCIERICIGPICNPAHTQQNARAREQKAFLPQKLFALRPTCRVYNSLHTDFHQRFPRVSVSPLYFTIRHPLTLTHSIYSLYPSFQSFIVCFVARKCQKKYSERD